MVDWNDDLSTFKAKKKAMFSDELGKIGRAAERGKAVNKTQEKHGKYSEQQMYAKKMKDMPVKKKLAELGIQLTVAAATNPNLGRGIQRVFTGNPIENIQDALTRQRLIRSNMRYGKESYNYYKERDTKLAENPPPHPSLPEDFAARQQHYLDKLAKHERNFSKENIYNRSVERANEDMALIQTSRALKKSWEKFSKEEVKKFRGESKRFFGNHNYRK